MTQAPELSIVIPVFNEERALPALWPRLKPALDKLGRSYEVIFVNDGSRDGSQALLENLCHENAGYIRVVELMKNAGQHRAIMAGFAQVRGQIVVTLDCDLQNPPEEIAALLAKIDAGHDVVGGIRAQRHDHLWRKWLSKLSNWLRERITRMKMRDHGCMLRAYRRAIIDQVCAAQEATPYIPEMSWYFAANPTEIKVAHESRSAGASRYNLYRLLRLNFDLLTASSLAPLQWLTVAGFSALAAASLWLCAMLVLALLGNPTRLIIVLIALVCWLASLAVLGVGLIGEYVGRIYLEVRARPHYVIKDMKG